MTLSRILRGISIVAFTLFVVLYAYVVYQFPNAPIEQVGDRYVDASGAIHSRDAFEQSKAWERAYNVSFVTTIATIVATRVAVWMERRRGHSV